MPLDKKGKFHANPATARMHDAAPEPIAKPEVDDQQQTGDDAEHGHESIHHFELHPHGDGSHHTITHFQRHHPEHTEEGSRMEHGSHQEAEDHMRAQCGDGDADSSQDTGSADAGGSQEDNDSEY